MVQRFQVGYAPDLWGGLVATAQAEGLVRRGFELAGLVSEPKHGKGGYDRFRHRLVFPILDAVGRPIAFGARQLRDQDDPKYLNSPETVWFNKSATLYGLHLAKKPIIDSLTAVVVEGYTDVIACHQAGVCNVVATLGTAFTRGHAGALARLCDRVVLIFDADQAGQRAADRAVDVFLSGSVDVAVAVLPDGLDPAGLLAMPQGAGQLRTLIDQAVDALEYKLTRIRVQLEKTDTLTGKERVVQQVLRELVGLGVLGQSAIRRAMVVGRLAQLLDVSRRDVESQLKELSGISTKVPARGVEPADGRDVKAATDADNFQSGVAWSESAHKIGALQLAERHVIGCLLRQPALFHQRLFDSMTLDEALTPAEMVTPQSQTLYAHLHAWLSDDRVLTLPRFLADLAFRGNQDLANLATHAEAEVEARCGDDGQRLETQLREAVESILRHHKERWYQQNRQALFDGDDDGIRSFDEFRLGELLAHRRDHPSAIRIARSIADT